jgi:hypothetical protein
MRRFVTRALVARLCSGGMRWGDHLASVSHCRSDEAAFPLLRRAAPPSETSLRRCESFVSISTFLLGATQLVAQPVHTSRTTLRNEFKLLHRRLGAARG